MKTWVFVFLCFASARAFASSADSGRCPWKLPFTISLQATGSEHTFELARSLLPGGWYEHDSDYGTVPSTDSIRVTVDTAGLYLSDSIQYSLIGDKLQYSGVQRVYGYPHLTSVSIVFARGKDSIISMEVSTLDTFGTTTQGWDISYDLKISNLAFDDSSIFISDSSFQGHSVSFIHSDENIYGYVSEYDYDETFDVFTAASVTLSGIFRPSRIGPPPPGRPTPGSGCPWKVPFTLHVHAAGETVGHGEFVPQEVGMGNEGIALNNDAVPDTEDFSFTVDSLYSFKNDTLRFNVPFFAFSGTDSEVVMIAFEPGFDSILSISCSETVGGKSDYFQISSLQFDSTGIFVTDSSFKNHNTSITIDGGCQNYVGPHQYVSIGNNFVASSASPSGIFRPTDLEDSTTTYKPLHVPFQMNIHLDGYKSAGWPIPDSDISIKVWCSSPSKPNTFYFRSGYEDCGGTAQDTSLEIDFIPGTDSVSAITLSVKNTFFMDGPGSPCSPLGDEWNLFTTTALFTADNFVHDSASISSADSSFCAHHISMIISSVDAHDCTWQLSTDSERLFTAASATLSGIFRPTHYTCSESVAEPKPSDCQNLTITALKNSLYCRFEASANPRTLKVYSILGTTLATVPIPSDATETTISQLPPGFYFIRLGNEVSKAIVTE